MAQGIVLACALTRASAEVLCAFRTESGALVYTNTPTNEGLCPSAEKAPRIGSPSADTRARYDPIIRQWSQRYGVSPRLVHAVVGAESAYNPGAVSPKGAKGLMQLMPEVARRYGVRDSFDAVENVRGGVAHLRDLLDAFGGDTRLAVAAYNAGQQAVVKHSGVPPYRETQQYVAQVMGKLRDDPRGLTRASGASRSGSSVQLHIDPSGGISLVN